MLLHSHFSSAIKDGSLGSYVTNYKYSAISICSLLLPKYREHNSEPNNGWYVQSVPSGGCCLNCRCSCWGSCSCRGRCSCRGHCRWRRCGKHSSLSHTCPHISYTIYSSQLHNLWAAGGSVGNQGNILNPCFNHCAHIQSTIPLANGYTLNASSIDAISEIGNELPLGGSTTQWSGITGWCVDYLANWVVNICHLDTEIWKEWKVLGGWVCVTPVIKDKKKRTLIKSLRVS